MNTKHILYLIQSFPAYSKISEGLIGFLSSHFEVIFIDLPGSTKENKRTTKFTLKHAALFVDKITSKETRNFILGGFSFGCKIASLTKERKNCIGFLFAEPYINCNYLKAGKAK